MKARRVVAHRILTGSIAAVALAAAAQAQTFNWNIDGGGSWITDTNWTPTVVGDWPKDPADVANLTFNLTQTAAITLDAPITVGALTVGDTNASHTYTLGNGTGGSLNFDNSGSAATLTETATGLSDVVSATMTTAGALNVVNANTTAGRVFTLSGPLSSSALAGTQAVTFNQASANAAVSVTGAISNGASGGTIALSKTGSGTLTLGATNSYTGGTTLSAGTIVGNAASALTGTFTQSGTSTLRINNYAVTATADAATGAIVNASAGTLTMNSNAVAGNAVSVALGALNVTGNYAIRAGNNGTALAAGTIFTLAAPLTISGAPTITSNSDTNASVTVSGQTTLNSDVTISPTTTFRLSAITEDATARKITKTGTGVLNILGVSNHSGGSDILNGTMQFNVTGAAGSGSILVGDTSGTNGADVRVGVGATLSNAITIRSGSSGTMKVSRDSGGTAGTGTVSGTITMQKATTFENASSATAGTATLDITGQVTGANQKITVTRGGSANSQFVRFTNALNDFGFAAATDDAITVGNGVFIVTSDAALGAAGNNITLNGTASSFRAEGIFSTARKLTFTAVGSAVDATPGSELTLTANGQIAGTTEFSKGAAAGTLIITGDNSARTLGTQVRGGVLRISSSANIGTTSPVTLNAGTLSLVNDTATSLGNTISVIASSGLNADRATGGVGDGLTHTLSTIAIGGQTLTFTNGNNYSITTGAVTSTTGTATGTTLTNNLGGTGILTVPSIATNATTSNSLTLRGTGNTFITGDITTSGAGVTALVKNDAGTVTLGGTSNHAGATTITAGTLRLTLSNQIASSTGASVGAGSTLDLRSDVALTNTVPIALNSSTGFLNVDRAVGGAGVNQTHVVGNINVGTTATPNITGGNGYGLTAGTVAFVDSAGLRNDAPGLVTLAGITVNNAVAKTLTLRGTGNTVVTAGISQIGVGAYGLTKLDAGTLTLNAAGTFTGNTAIGNTTTVGGTLKLGAAGAIPNTGITVLTGTLDMNGFDLNPTSVTMGDGPTATSANIITNGGTLILGGNVTYNTEAGHLGAFIVGNVSLGGATRTFTTADTTGTDPDLTVTGAISDATGSLIKAGTGQLLLAGTTANTWVGVTQVAAGMLQFGKSAGTNAVPGDVSINPTTGHSSIKNVASNQIPDTAVVTLTGTSGIGGGHWDLNGFDETVASLAWNNNQGSGSEVIATGAGTLTVNGNITFAGTSTATSASPVIPAFSGNLIDGKLSLGGATRTIDTPTATGFGGAISAAISNGGILKTGPNLLVLSGANTYAGGTEVQAGTLDLRNVGAAGAGNVVLNGGNLTFRHNGDGTTTPETFNFTGPVTVQQNTTLLADRIGGTGTTKTLTIPSLTIGGQTINVTANNTYTLGVLGAVSLTASPTFNVTAGTFALNGGASDGGGGFGITKQGAGSLTFGAASTLKSLTITGGTVGGAGTITLSDDLNPLTLRNNTVSPNVTFTGAAGAAITFDSTSNGTATLSGTVDLGAVSRTFLIPDGTTTPDMNLTGALAGLGGWIKDGGGNLRLGGTAANTYSGTVTINAGTLSLNKPAGTTAITGDLLLTNGTVTMLASDQIADTASVTVNGGTFNFHNNTAPGFNETFVNFTTSGGTTNTFNGTGTPSLINLTGTLTLNAGSTFNVNSNSSLTANKVVITGGTHVIGGNTSAQVNVLTVGAGGLELTGGNMRMNLGTGSALGSQLQLGGNVTSFASGTEAGVFGSSTTDTVGTRAIDLGGTDRIFAVEDGPATNDLRFQYPITGTAGLVKTGPGQLLLEATNTYAGTTTINEGTLMLTGSLAGAVSVGADGVLAGTGNIAGATTVGGLLSPGSSAGTLDLNGSLALGNGSSLVLEIGGGFPGDGFGLYDQVNMNNAAGAITIGTGVTLSLALIDGYLPFEGDDFYLVNRADAGGYGGIFASLPEGAVVNLGSGYFGTLTYLADWTGAQIGSFETGGNDIAILNATTVPEPSAAAVLAVAALGLGLRRRRARD